MFTSTLDPIVNLIDTLIQGASNAASPAPLTETQPATGPIPAETMPDDPNDAVGVGHQIIEEIEKIGRRYTNPRK